MDTKTYAGHFYGILTRSSDSRPISLDNKPMHLQGFPGFPISRGFILGILERRLEYGIRDFGGRIQNFTFYFLLFKLFALLFGLLFASLFASLSSLSMFVAKPIICRPTF